MASSHIFILRLFIIGYFYYVCFTWEPRGVLLHFSCLPGQMVYLAPSHSTVFWLLYPEKDYPRRDIGGWYPCPDEKYPYGDIKLWRYSFVSLEGYFVSAQGYHPLLYFCLCVKNWCSTFVNNVLHIILDVVIDTIEFNCMIMYKYMKILVFAFWLYNGLFLITNIKIPLLRCWK